MVEDLTYPVLVSLSKTEWEYIVVYVLSCILSTVRHCQTL